VRVIIAGSRGITSIEHINQAMEAAAGAGILPSVVISGTARGVDQLGEQWAAAHKCPVERYPADWTNLGKSAGYRRNVMMADVADALVAIWDGESRGTQHMVDIACAKKLRVFVWQL
jgi:hypothetical protein